MKKSKVLFLFFIFFLFNLHCESSLNKFFFELFRFEITGISDYKNIEQFSNINKTPFKWTLEKGPVRIYELFNSKYSGEIEATYKNSIDNNYVEAFNSIVANLNYVFSVKTPEILNVIENTNNDDNVILDNIQKVAENLENNFVEKRILDSENKLALFSFDNEILSIQKRDDKNIVISSDEKKTTRRFFDENNRVIKKEIWDISGSFKNSFLKKEENYFYEELKSYPKSATLFEENTKIELKYNEFGKVVSSEKYDYVPKNKEKEDLDKNNKKNVLDKGQNYVLTNKTVFKYNDSGKITEKTFIEYSYVKQKVFSSSKKDVYEYKIKDGLPDYYFYENDILRMKTIYFESDSYITTLYFDNNFVVESVYKNGNHTKDLFYSNGTIIRQKKYE